MAVYLNLVVVTALVTLTGVEGSNSFRPQSYHRMMADAEASLHAAARGQHSLVAQQLKDLYPLLASPSRFQHKVVEVVNQLSSNDDLLGKIDSGFLENLDSSLFGNASFSGRADGLPYNLSAQCVADLQLTLSALSKGQGWAWSMIDAMGKPLGDIKDGNLIWPGSYSECRAVHGVNVTGNASSSAEPVLFSGRSCYTVISLGKTPAPIIGVPKLAMILCVPTSCSGYDISVMMNIALYELKVKLPSTPYAVCNMEDKDVDSNAVAGMVVVAVFVCLMLVGTTLDVVYTLLPKWRHQSLDDVSTNSDPAFNFNRRDDDDVLLLGTLPPTKAPEPRFAAKLLMAFSVYTNGAKLLSTDQPGGLTCIHGVRFLSMTWVVLGHTFLFPVFTAENVAPYLQDFAKRWTAQAILNATFSVDSFFVMSGLLVTYLTLRELKRTGGKLNWAKFYFHRFWRLTPPYLLIIAVYTCLGKFWGSGPMWPDAFPDRDNCRTTWWTNILYINNFVHVNETCLGQSWYLSNDMQFYILSPLLIVPLYSSPLYGMAAVLVFFIATVVTPAALTVKYHFGTSSGGDGDHTYMIELYTKPYCRMGAYLVGMVTGYLLFRTDCTLRISKKVNLLCWSVAAAIALSTLYGLYDQSQGHPVSLGAAAVYNALSRTGWGLALAWVIFACCTGNGGFVNTILSWKALVPLSRLTYCIYLLHLMVLFVYLYSRQSLFFYSDQNLVFLFLGLLVICYMVSAVVSLAFEAPMMALEKLVLNYKKDQ